jgi:LPXTG-motif cell wall-anchored protein
MISSAYKSQNPSANNSIVFTPFSNNTASTNPMSCTVKNKKFKSASNSIPHENNNNNNNNNNNHSKSDSTSVDNKVNVLLNELNKQLKECPNEGDINKIIDKKFNIIKTSYYNFVKMLPSEIQQNYLLNVMEMITTILNFKNDQISELTTNSSLEHHIHPYSKKKVPLNQMYAKQIVRMSNKQSKEQEKQMLSKTVNVLRKEAVDSDENEGTPEDFPKPYVSYNVMKLDITKTDTNQTKVLEGAEFSLRLKNSADAENIMYMDATATTDANGKATFKAISVLNAIECILKETKSPSGYMLDESEREVILKGNEIIEIAITNMPIYELPSTGGYGSFLYTLSGAALVLSSSLMKYKKKREEELGSEE